MGWSSGTQYLDFPWELIEEYLPDDKKTDIFIEWFELLREGDWDTYNESEAFQGMMNTSEQFVGYYYHSWEHITSIEDLEYELRDREQCWDYLEYDQSFIDFAWEWLEWYRKPKKNKRPTIH